LSHSVSISKIYKAFTEARTDEDHIARLCVVGAEPELTRVVGHLSAGAVDGHGGVSAALDALSPADFPRDAALVSRWDIVVVLAIGADAAELEPVVATARAGGRQVVALVPTPHGPWADAAGVTDDEVAHHLADEHGTSPTLENRIVHAAGDAGVSLAVQLPSLRRAYCDRVVLANATQNAVIGAVVIIPGADMPAMTANQVRMVLKIAAVYGEQVGLDRAVEIASVVGTAFVFRALARQALDFVPGFGWALKGGVGFAATVALGEAAIAYFEAGAPLQVSHMQRISQQLERARSKLPGFLQQRIGPR
jgi:uncharacterized protein (DUF697 family)